MKVLRIRICAGLRFSLAAREQGGWRMGTGHMGHGMRALSPVPASLQDLSAGERVLLQALRLWHGTRPDSLTALCAMAERLRVLNAPAAVIPLSILLGIMATARHPRPLPARDGGGGGGGGGGGDIGTREWAFLRMLAAFHQGRGEEGASILGQWLPAVSLGTAVEAGERLARELRIAGVELSVAQRACCTETGPVK
jgi:hypothetical protein